MSRRTYRQSCSIAKTLEIVGERWTLLIVRNAFRGECRFDTFLQSLGLPRNVLTDRLNTLVDNGILQRVPYQQRPLRNEYLLTDKGRDLGPILLALMHWGDQYTVDESGPPRVAYHDFCGSPIELHVMCPQCERQVKPEEVKVRHTMTAG